MLHYFKIFILSVLCDLLVTCYFWGGGEYHVYSHLKCIIIESKQIYVLFSSLSLSLSLSISLSLSHGKCPITPPPTDLWIWIHQCIMKLSCGIFNEISREAINLYFKLTHFPFNWYWRAVRKRRTRWKWPRKFLLIKDASDNWLFVYKDDTSRTAISFGLEPFVSVHECVFYMSTRRQPTVTVNSCGLQRHA